MLHDKDQFCYLLWTQSFGPTLHQVFLTIMYIHVSKCNFRYSVPIVLMLSYRTHLLLLRWDTVKVRDRFGTMIRFKVWGRVNSVIADVKLIRNVITERYYVKAQCKNVNVHDALYQMINVCKYTVVKTTILSGSTF